MGQHIGRPSNIRKEVRRKGDKRVTDNRRLLRGKVEREFLLTLTLRVPASDR